MMSIRYLTLISLLSLVCISDAFASNTNGQHWLTQPVSLEFNNEPLRKVLGRISSETGVAIMYDEALGGELVTGFYKEVSLEKAIMRLFTNRNKSLIIHDAKRLVIVRNFGAKNYVWAETTLTDLPSPEGMSAEDLAKMHDEQYREYRADIEDDTVEMEGGMTRREIMTMHVSQHQSYVAEVEDGNFLGGFEISRDAIQALHEEQYAEFRKRAENKKEVLEGGITGSELETMHSAQYSSYLSKLQNKELILENGMTLEEIRQMHNRQYEGYKLNN